MFLNNPGIDHNVENHGQTLLVQVGFEAAFRVRRGPENARANRAHTGIGTVANVKQKQALQMFENRAL